MNATRYEFQVNVFPEQLEESALCLLHTILFHRTTGKFKYQKKGEFLIGTLGYQDVHCQTINLTYVKTESAELHTCLLENVRQFVQQYNSGNKTLTLEFFQKKRGRWPFSSEEPVPWEVWAITFVEPSQNSKETPAESVVTNMVSIAEKINNSNSFLPKTPNQSDLGLVYECNFCDVQPYLFRCQYQGQMSTLKKLFKDVSL
ncbi:Oidioi.mRNA.OKI2018_I69.chr1.g1832.t1.cds [Oikopleura dioica]|uniref:Autophagy-related protein 101 n=1 Tax=Oikopleura dioica TaxID=34765 RepID=A0ABN7SP58_OIKDI|nr:Oidioi.mRNA.OKI2018_I69.chr1.g1832.t1.cds [Oikopleura dioica]